MTESPAPRQSRIVAAFDGAADYDSAALVQRDSALRLADRIAAAGDWNGARILELGCGTGFLTMALAARALGARWTVSDVAPAMVARARAALSDRLGPDAAWRLIDGEAVDPAIGPVDLIASNLAFQWFADLPGAVTRLCGLLGPGGLLAFSTMAEGSFAEWTDLLAEDGRTAGTPAYPGQEALTALAPPGYRADVEIVEIHRQEQDARSFLRRLKAIGAGTPVEGHRPVPPAALRRALARFDAGPRRITYRLGYCLIRAG